MKTTVLPLRAVVLLLILTLVWGTSWPLFPFAMRQISVWTFRAVTLSAGGLLVLALARLGGHPLTIPRQDRRSLIFSAIIYLSVWNICSGYSAITIPSGQTAVLGFTMPLWSALISWAILGETLPRRLILALVFGGSAVMCLMVSGLAAYAHAPAGFAAGLLGGVGWAIGTLIFKRRRINAHALVVTGWQLLIASVPISAAALVLGNHVWFVPTWQSLAVVSYLTLFPISIGNICWFSLKNSRNLFFCGVHLGPSRLPYWSLQIFSAPPIQRIFNGFEYRSGISAYLKGHPRIFS